MTRNFEDVVLNGIPQSVAADFFIRVKTAGWGDPPDETGVLEGQFAVPLEQVIGLVSQVAAEKFKLMMAYHVYAESMRGVAQHACAEVFHEHAEQERAAAEAYLKRAAVLGGGPIHLPELEPPTASSDPVGILMLIVRAEQEAIALQNELRQAVGDSNPLGFQIEQFMIEDQHHMDEAWQMLPADVVRNMTADPAAMEAPVDDAHVAAEESAAEPPAPPAEAAEEQQAAEEEIPAEAKQAFARALSKIAGTVIPFPGKGERMLRSAGKALGSARDSVSNAIGNMSTGTAATLGAGGLGALVGGSNQSAAVHAMSEEDKAKHIERGGPLTRLAVEHPAAFGATLGGLSLGGGVAAAQALTGKPLGALGAVGVTAAPAVATVLADRLLKDKTAAFKLALRKLALSPPEPGLGTDPGSAAMPDTQPAMAPTPSMAQPGVQPPMATQPGMARYAPVNYLEAEETARRAQAANEANFYRGQAADAQTQAQSMGAQVQEIQAQLDQLSAQAAESQNQIMAANEEAVRANDQMLNQATLAARMRMGMQQLRAQMMEVASQDPEQLAAAAGGPTPMDVGMQAQQAAAGPAGAPPSADGGGEPGAQPGAPGAAPDPGVAPGGAPAASGGPPGAGNGSGEASNSDGKDPNKKDGGETTVSIKKGSARNPKTASLNHELLSAAAGGLIGAGAGYLHANRGAGAESLRSKVEALKGQQDGGFGKALELAKTNVSLIEADEARANPMKSALNGGLLGAGVGAGLAQAIPAAISGGKELFKNLGTIANNAKQLQ